MVSCHTVDNSFGFLIFTQHFDTDINVSTFSFAIQAGREIRIIAKPDEVGDDAIGLLARDISKKIESELEYPGQIKVNVVRETRAVDYAK